MPFDPNDESLDFSQYLGADGTLPQADADPEESAVESAALSDYFSEISTSLSDVADNPDRNPIISDTPDASGSAANDDSITPPNPESAIPAAVDTNSPAVPEQSEAEPAENFSYTPPPSVEETDPQIDFILSKTSAEIESSASNEGTEKKAPENSVPGKSSKKKVAVRKGRPRRKKGEGFLGIPNIIVTAVWCSLILLIGLTLGRMMWLCAAEVLAFGKNDVVVTVTINENDTIDDIATKLAREGLIQYRELFKLYARFAVDDGDIKPGVWELNTKYDYHALVNGMSPSSTHSVVKVTIPEGYTCRQIFSLLEEKKVCSSQELSSYAASGELGSYWFLDGITRGDPYCLEGYLFPDTYEFYTNDSPRSVLSRMLNNFDSKFDDSLRWQINQLNETLTSMMRRNGKSEAFITENQFTVQKVVIVASMIEKETSSSEEGYMIASVIYNRLFNWGSTPAYLNIDATIVYATGGDNENIAANLQIDSPYNTYRYTGLTPGPISNPGLASLKAALEPNSSNYYYYVLDPSVNHHIFATSQAEHDANVAAVNQRS